ncbi:MAG: hypothetical protein KAG26_01980, partial [Methylococcales bacterium]|nr:hypothetical protein [Methylococcales bacterium]
FGCLSLDISKTHQAYFKSLPPLEASFIQHYQQITKASYEKLSQLEKDDNVSFEVFLKNYFK